MDVSKSYVMFDGTAVHYRLWRAPQRARGVLVLLHGLSSNHTRWSEFTEHTALRQEWDILRPDLRGHAESFARGRVGLPIWSDDLVELLDANRYERAVLVGHSLGAHLAMYFAARFPERVRGLILIDPAFPKALRGTWRVFRWLLRPAFSVTAAVIRFLNRVGLRRREFPQRDLRIWDERVRRELLGSGLSKEFVQRYSSTSVDLKYIPVAHYVQELAEMLRPLPRPSKIPAPTLFLLSRGVTYTNPSVTERLIDGFAHVERRDIDAYHWPLTEKPAEVRAEIERWIAEHFGQD